MSDYTVTVKIDKKTIPDSGATKATREELIMSRSGRKHFVEQKIFDEDNQIITHLVTTQPWADKIDLVRFDKTNKITEIITTTNTINYYNLSPHTLGLHSMPVMSYGHESDLDTCIKFDNALHFGFSLTRNENETTISYKSRTLSIDIVRKYDKYDRPTLVEVNKAKTNEECGVNIVKSFYDNDESILPSRIESFNSMPDKKMTVESRAIVVFSNRSTPHFFTPNSVDLVKGQVYSYDTGNLKMRMMQYNGKGFQITDLNLVIENKDKNIEQPIVEAPRPVELPASPRRYYFIASLLCFCSVIFFVVIYRKKRSTQL